jgi:hypothetical protein
MAYLYYQRVVLSILDICNLQSEKSLKERESLTPCIYIVDAGHTIILIS